MFWQWPRLPSFWLGDRTLHSHSQDSSMDDSSSIGDSNSKFVVVRKTRVSVTQTVNLLLRTTNLLFRTTNFSGRQICCSDAKFAVPDNKFAVICRRQSCCRPQDSSIGDSNSKFAVFLVAHVIGHEVNSVVAHLLTRKRYEIKRRGCLLSSKFPV